MNTSYRKIPVFLLLLLAPLLLPLATGLGWDSETYPFSSLQTDPVTFEVVNHFGGLMEAVAVPAGGGNTVYIGEGGGFTALDASDLDHLQRSDSLAMPGDVVEDIALLGNIAYVVDGTGLRLIDLAQPGFALVGQLDLPDLVQAVAVAGAHAYVLSYHQWYPANHGQLHIVDVSDSASPALIASYDLPGAALAVQAAGATVYVADGDSGLQILDVSDPAHPAQLGSYDTPGSAQKVQVAGTTAYVADANSGLLLLEVSDPAHPALLGSYDTPGSAEDVQVVGSTAYLADGDNGLLVLDVSDPAHPVLLGHSADAGPAEMLSVTGNSVFVEGDNILHAIDVGAPASPALRGVFERPGEIADIFIPATQSVLAAGQQSGPFAYVASAERLWVLGLSDPEAPEPLGKTPLAHGSVQALYVATDRAYVATGNGGVEIFDVSDPAHPGHAGQIAMPGYAGWVHDVFVEGNHAYVVGARLIQPPQGWLSIVDVSDPAHPAEVGTLDLAGEGYRLHVAGGIAYVAADEAGLRLIDVSDPAAPVEVGHVDPPAGARSAVIVVDGDEAFVASNSENGAWVQKIDVSDPAHPVVGPQYQAPAPAQVMDLQIAGEYVYASVQEGSLLALTRSQMSVAGALHSETGRHLALVINLELTAAGATGEETVKYVWSAEASRWIKIIKPKYDYPTPEPSPSPTPECAVVGSVEPGKAHSDGCAVIPPQKQCECSTEMVNLTAREAGGWAFKTWSQSPPVRCPGSGVTEVVAQFQPTLSVSGSGAAGLCATGKESTKTALTILLTASPADTWKVSSFTFRASGNGDDKMDIKTVKLFKGGSQLGVRTYDADNGFVTFKFPTVFIPAGSTVTFHLDYEFNLDQMAAQCGGEVREYGVTLTSNNSEAVNYPPGLRTGSAGGMARVGCVLNPETEELFDSIQQGVDQAAAGSSLLVCPGTFSENVRLDKTLKLSSAGTVDDTIVQAQDGNRPVFEISGAAQASANHTTGSVDHVIIQGLHIQGGNRGVSIAGNVRGAQIGGENEGEGNIISDYTLAGVGVAEGSTENAILGNLIYNNNSTTALAIDLNNDGLTYDDADDTDEGANHLQNFPLLRILDNGVISGTVNSIPGKPLRVELFLDRQCESFAPGDAEVFLGTVSTTPEGDNTASFIFTPPVAVQPGQGVVATATDPDGNTSELTPCPENLVFKVDNEGNVFVDGSYQSPAADFAELWPASADATSLQPGDVLALGPDGGVLLAGSPDAGSVIGVYVSRPGFLGGGPQSGIRTPPSAIPVAMVGIVSMRVSVENGAIVPGDLLALSATPGVAARARPVRLSGKQFYLPGSFFAKALEAFAATDANAEPIENISPTTPPTGTIRVLLVGP